MSNNMYPCFWFNGQAKDAASFYCTIFKNATIIADTPMLVTFTINGQQCMALNGGSMFTINPSISLFVKSTSLDEVNTIWNKLIDGGKVLMAIDTYDWSKRYGWLQDKYGITWQIMLSDVEDNITPAMLFTNNQFGNAEEAIKLYTAIFKNSTIDALEHYPSETPFAGKVMYSSFKLNQHQLIAMDGPGAHNYTFNEAVSFVINCHTQDDIDYYWDKLTDGGEEGKCGWLKDKFGVSWQIVPSILGKLMTNAEKAPRIMAAFMQMKKFDIETLVNA